MAAFELPASHASIAESLRSNDVDPELIERLEAYVDEQAQTQTYDFAANKALLKLYQFFPDRNNEQTIATVLAKALMALPSTDMMLLLYLIPEATQSNETIQTLVTCAEHLEAGKFDTFWEVANLGGNELLDRVPGFPDAVRSFMIGVLSTTFQKLEGETFTDLLALELADLEEYVSSHSDVISLEGSNVMFAANENNQPRAKKFEENISFNHMLPLIDLLSGS